MTTTTTLTLNPINTTSLVSKIRSTRGRKIDYRRFNLVTDESNLKNVNIMVGNSNLGHVAFPSVRAAKNFVENSPSTLSVRIGWTPSRNEKILVETK